VKLVVSFRDNPHVEAVLEHLRRPWVVIDVADFPTRAALNVAFSRDEELVSLRLADGTVVRSETVGAVWYRRERPMEIDPLITDPRARLFAWSESNEAFTGFLRTLHCYWMNPPAADEEAQRKIRQLQLARAVGLPVPETCITNDPTVAREFVLRHPSDGVVRKAFRNIREAPRPTKVVNAADRDRLDDVRYAPVTLQEYVPALLDLRVLVVEDEVFTAAIRSAPEYQVDYRPGIGSAEFSAYALPDEVANALLELHRQLGLVFGASDLRVTPDGAHVFLEVNPGGEYLFASERAGLPVPEAIAAALARHDTD
jgi:glutathione synthase/RimK-type ligase-like ATP-grasp enzyme